MSHQYQIQMKATLKIFLRKVKDANGQRPVIMRVTKDRKTKIITLGLKASDKEWDFDKNRYNKRSNDYQKKNRVLLKIESRALSIINEFVEDNFDFTLNQFESKFRGFKNKTITVKKYLNILIDKKEDLGKYGPAEPFRNLKSALFKHAKSSIMFKDIDYEFLVDFENYLRRQGNTDGGIAFKMRHLRIIFNRAINEDIVDRSAYPFRKYKISKLKSEPNKIALNLNELRRFKDVDLTGHMNLLKSHMLFMFSFYCRGINWVDMMELKWTDIYDGKIHYIRKKTKQSFVIEITDSLKRILDYFKNNYPSRTYVFPILLKEGLTAKQKKDRNKKAIKAFNTDLREIASFADISKHITSYVARHTYATYLYNEGKSIEIISASMGHSSVLVTMSYLKEFEDSVLDEANRIKLEEPLVPIL